MSQFIGGRLRPRRVLEILTTIEILAYRAVLLVTFLVYAIKHIRAEWLGP